MAEPIDVFYDAYLALILEKKEIPAELTSQFHLFVRELDEPTRKLITVAEHLAREYARGIRCGVCGMTTAQSEAANYDCTTEC